MVASPPNPFTAPTADARPFAAELDLPPDCRPECLELRQRLFGAERAVVAWGRVYLVVGALAAVLYLGLEALMLVGVAGGAPVYEAVATTIIGLGLLVVWLGFVAWTGWRLTRVDPESRVAGAAVGVLGLCLGPLGLVGIVPTVLLLGSEATQVLDWSYAVARKETASLDLALLRAHRASVPFWRRGLAHRYGLLLMTVLGFFAAMVTAVAVIVALTLLGQALQSNFDEIEQQVQQVE